METINIDSIISIVIYVTNVNKSLWHRKSRQHDLVLSRQLMHFFAKKYTKLTLEKIGEKIGNKDHATVLHSIKVIENYLSTDDKKVKRFTKEIENRLKYYKFDNIAPRKLDIVELLKHNI